MDVMGLISSVTQGVTAYRTAVETLDEAKITAATHELTVQLIHLGAEVLSMQKDRLQATESERALLTRVHYLEEQVRELEKLRAERDRYELVEPYPGIYVFRVKEASRDGEPEHYLCQGCLDNRAVKSILQFQGDKKRLANCPSCKTQYRFQNDPPRKPRPLLQPVGVMRR
ncbi:hypothetical protein NIZ92_11610 [Alcaligenes sp. 1735tsa3]|uniref:hypothetical protein n=1 Tax=Alcaligenes sp. 1735tsa3 TaxID=2953809 RepID=UPI0020A78834|nr:hypothetical protein [Alcaligenes sp. 1735tsa3]USY23969.1 hypothetical protein NIZ92_11610 [Alcaligenes sp. 1735tsa3]